MRIISYVMVGVLAMSGCVKPSSKTTLGIGPGSTNKKINNQQAAIIRSTASLDTTESLIALTEQGVVWASEVVLASSEWAPETWGAVQLLGPPDVFPMYANDPRVWADSNLAWAAKEKDLGQEVLEIRFSSFVNAKGVIIAETHSPGGIVRIEDPEDGTILWEGVSPTATSEQMEMMRVSFDTPRMLGSLRLIMNTKTRAYWEELDAVGLLMAEAPSSEERELALAELEKKREDAAPVVAVQPTQPVVVQAEEGQEVLDSLDIRKVVWASGVVGFSSEWNSSEWSSASALGAPNVLPDCVDDPKAWAAKDADQGMEYLSLSFPATRAAAVVIAESLTPGSVVKIEEISNPKSPVVLWDGPVQKITDKCRVVERVIKPQVIRALRITLNTSEKPYWEEIDAVGLIPAK